MQNYYYVFMFARMEGNRRWATAPERNREKRYKRRKKGRKSERDALSKKQHSVMKIQNASVISLCNLVYVAQLVGHGAERAGQIARTHYETGKRKIGTMAFLRAPNLR